MSIQNQLLFLFSALGALNALILSLYFALITKKKQFSNYYLSLLLLTLGIRILKSSFFYFSPHLADYFIQIGLSACALIGPFLFLYIRSQLNKETWKYSYLFHVVPFLIIMVSLGVYFPYWSNKPLWTDLLIPLIYWQWFIYIVATGIHLKPIFKKISKEKLKDIETWYISIFCGVFFIWLAYIIASYTSYLVGALSFSFVFYLLILLWLFKNKHNSLFFEEKSPYENKYIDQESLKRISNNIGIVVEKKLFKDPNINLARLASYLNVSPHFLSQYLNENLGKSFSYFLNEYRVEEAKSLLTSKSNFTIEVIGYDSGFNSKSTFFTTFKKFTGYTPSQYRKLKGF